MACKCLNINSYDHETRGQKNEIALEMVYTMAEVRQLLFISAKKQ